MCVYVAGKVCANASTLVEQNTSKLTYARDEKQERIERTRSQNEMETLNI